MWKSPRGQSRTTTANTFSISGENNKNGRFNLTGWRKDVVQWAAVVGVILVVVLPVILIDFNSSGGGGLPLDRIPCFSPDDTVTEEACRSVGCLFDSYEGAPSCFLPGPQKYGYRLSGEIEETGKGSKANLVRLVPESGRSISLQGEDLENAMFEATYVDDNVLRYKIWNEADSDRFQVPVDLNINPSADPTNRRYELQIKNNRTADSPFVFQVLRSQNQEVLFDTGLGGLTLSDQFLMISTKLQCTSLVGLGHSAYPTLNRLSHSYQSWPLFSRASHSSNSTEQRNLEGVYPFYICYEGSGLAHGVLFLNSGPMEISMLPLPGLVFKTIGGIVDVLMFLGPSPEDVVRQYSAIIGKPIVPAFWSLGLQVANPNWSSLEAVKDDVEAYRMYGLPMDVVVLDQSYMNNSMDFTYDSVGFSGLPQFMRESNLRFVLAMNPAIPITIEGYGPHESAMQSHVYTVWANESLAPSTSVHGDILVGSWPNGPVAFPDWLKPETAAWWKNEFADFYAEVPFHGIWLDLNQPVNFGTNSGDNDHLVCPTNKWDDPPCPTLAVRPALSSRLSDDTICMVAAHGQDKQYLHYDIHNIIGLKQAEATFGAIQEATGRRGLVSTSSSFPSTGQWAGSFFTRHIASWENLRMSLHWVLEYNLYGVPLVGADGCGQYGEADDELCQRWIAVSAFYPMSRISTELDITASPPLRETARKMLKIRYSLLPYLYTLLYAAHIQGGTVVRSLVHEFPSDTYSALIEYQFLWGPSLMISPVVFENQNVIEIYFPEEKWYDFYTGDETAPLGGKVAVVAPLDHMPLHVRAGAILPMQDPASRTDDSRLTPFTLLVALHWNQTAAGDLYWDDGDSIDAVENNEIYHALFTFYNTTLTLSVIESPKTWTITKDMKLNRLRVFGFHTNIRSPTVFLNGINETYSDIHYNPLKKTLDIFDLDVPLNTSFTLEIRETSSERIECPVSYKNRNGADEAISEDACLKACVWDPAPHTCSLPPLEDYGYVIDGEREDTDRGFKIPLRKLGDTLYGNDIKNIVFEVFMYDEHFVRLKFYDSASTRYEPPIPLNLPATGRTPSSSSYIVNVDSALNAPFAVTVTRRETGVTLFDTSISGLTFSDQLLSIATRLPSKNIYGLGEDSHSSFRRDLDGKVWPLFSADSTPDSKGSLNFHGVHPFYECLENDGNSHGVFLLNSNAMEYQLLPHPALVYRTLGGILDFFIFLGPDPESVISQYTGVIGRPFLPPYWSLGFHQSRWGYKDLQEVQEVIDRTRKCGVPQDAQHFDIDYMDKNADFTYDVENFRDLPKFVDDLEARGVRSSLVLNPGIDSQRVNYNTYNNGLQSDVYIRWPEDQNNGSYIFGQQWSPGLVAFPDFFKNSTRDWWISEIKNFHNHISFSALWNEMNEPTNYKDGLCSNTGNNLEDPPYWPKVTSTSGTNTPLSNKTLCMSTCQGTNCKFRHYDVHSLYGWSQAESTFRALQEATGKRGMVLSRSTFPSSGQWTGHSIGGTRSAWEDLRYSVVGMLNFNLFGIPFVGAAICGFSGEATEELCERWSEVGAFYPFSRNHNSRDSPDQDPCSWNGTVGFSSRKALEIRYNLLPYLYTLFYQAHVDGSTVVRPLFHEFPQDRRFISVDRQFLWGPALMISPAMEETATTVTIELPEGIWYDYYTGAPLVDGRRIELRAERDTIPLHIRGGHILPYQAPGINTVESRKNAFGLIVAVSLSGEADGHLFWDDGESIDTLEIFDYQWAKFVYNENELRMEIANSDFCNMCMSGVYLEEVSVLGSNKEPSSIKANGDPISTFSYDGTTRKMYLHDLHIPMNDRFTINFVYT